MIEPNANLTGAVFVGDTVLWRGGFGEDPAVPVKINCIEINTNGGKDGVSVNVAPWSEMRRDNAVLDLNNGHWCYGNQISPAPDHAKNNRDLAGDIMDQIRLGKTLEDIIITARGEDTEEPLDGDEVDTLVDSLRELINRHEGNT